MIYNIERTEEDFIIYQLYTASKSPSVKQKRRKNWLLVSSLFLLIGFMFRTQADEFNQLLSYYFFAFGVISFIAYPFYTRWLYKKHYIRHVKEHYKNRFGRKATFEIADGWIHTKDETSEGKIKVSEIIAIQEIKDYVLVQLNTSVSFILPTSRMENGAKLKQELLQLSDELKIPYNVELNWKWT